MKLTKFELMLLSHALDDYSNHLEEAMADTDNDTFASYLIANELDNIRRLKERIEKERNKNG